MGLDLSKSIPPPLSRKERLDAIAVIRYVVANPGARVADVISEREFKLLTKLTDRMEFVLCAA